MFIVMLMMAMKILSLNDDGDDDVDVIVAVDGEHDDTEKDDTTVTQRFNCGNFSDLFPTQFAEITLLKLAVHLQACKLAVGEPD